MQTSVLPRRVIAQPVYPVQLIAFSDSSQQAFGTVGTRTGNYRR